MSRFRIDRPSQTTLDGPRYGGKVSVTTGKPPKLRFKPGTLVKLEGQVYEVIYCYRVRENPHEWHYHLEERHESGALIMDQIGLVAVTLGCGKSTPRVVYEIFRDHGDASSYFMDIPRNADSWTVSNKKMMTATVLGEAK